VHLEVTSPEFGTSPVPERLIRGKIRLPPHGQRRLLDAGGIFHQEARESLMKIPDPRFCLLILSSAVIATPVWAATEGTSSTFYGMGAGASNAGGGTGGANTFVGRNAGTANNSGAYNAFIGSVSGAANTTGSNNTFVGDATGYHNTDASDNTFIGSAAGLSNTSGNSNTFVGSTTGYLTTTGSSNTFLGMGAGSSNTTGAVNTLLGAGAGYSSVNANSNTFVGASAGHDTTSASSNTFVGEEAGKSNIIGNNNVALGFQAGVSATGGSRNVFLGALAGLTEGGSNRLYIDTCFDGGSCSNPLVYGEFDNRKVRLNGMTEVHYNGQSKSQMNFSLTSTDTGGFLTSVLDNNFFMSSGARYDGTLAAPNQWVQRSPDGNSVIQGSGGLGYRIFTSSGHAQNVGFFPTVRLHINYAGEFGINQAPVPGHEIHTSSGAYLASGTWTNASSRELKDNIHDLPADAAEQTFAALKPVTFTYKADTQWQHVGFIAEDVPALVASPDRKGLSPMDIVAVLTKVVQEQKERLAGQDRQLADQRREFTSQIADQAQELQVGRSRGDAMEKQLAQLAAEVERLKARGK
jgi:hypothetical protein